VRKTRRTGVDGRVGIRLFVHSEERGWEWRRRRRKRRSWVAFGVAVNGCRENCIKDIQKGWELSVSKRKRATGGGDDVGRDVARSFERWKYGDEHGSEDVLCS
jgi:hypothetical protein